jgi:hypothetical protein
VAGDGAGVAALYRVDHFAIDAGQPPRKVHTDILPPARRTSASVATLSGAQG